MDLSTHSLTPAITVNGIRSLIGFGSLVRPLAHSVLYLRYLLCKASAIAISRRTSYHVISLAFHPYPQLIREFFNIHQFGPPRRVSCASSWPWVDHHASGLLNATSRPFRTRFRYGSIS